MPSDPQKISDIVRPSGRLWIGAPALLMLACAATQISMVEADEYQTATLDFSGILNLDWVIKGGVSHSVKQARWAVARRAVFLIDALDRASNMAISPICSDPNPLKSGWSLCESSSHGRRDLNPARTNHPTAAP